MKFSNLLTGLLFTSIASAFPYAGPHHDVALSARQGEEPLCAPETCGAICSRDASPGSRAISILKGLAGSFTKRAPNKPDEGQIDNWFKSSFQDANYQLDIHPKVEDEQYDFAYGVYEHNGRPMKAGVAGFWGCTGIVISNRQAVLMVHIWERHLKFQENLYKDLKAPQPEEDAWIKYTIDPLQKAINEFMCKVEGGDKNFQARIYTKAPPSPRTQKDTYNNCVDDLVAEIEEGVEGLRGEDVTVIGYSPQMDKANDMDVAAGKLLYVFDPNEGGKSSWQLWAGSMLKTDLSENMQPQDINSPVMSDAW